MKYENPSFSVLPPNSDEYRDNWDRIFGEKAPKTPSRRYFGGWSEFSQMVKDFDDPHGPLGGLPVWDLVSDDEVLFASYDNVGYDGHATVIVEQGGRLYEVGASHCSCYGLAGQWDPAPVTWDALAMRLTNEFDEGRGFLSEHSEEARAAFKELVIGRS